MELFFVFDKALFCGVEVSGLSVLQSLVVAFLVVEDEVVRESPVELGYGLVALIWRSSYLREDQRRSTAPPLGLNGGTFEDYDLTENIGLVLHESCQFANESPVFCP